MIASIISKIKGWLQRAKLPEISEEEADFLMSLIKRIAILEKKVALLENEYINTMEKYYTTLEKINKRLQMRDKREQEKAEEKLLNEKDLRRYLKKKLLGGW